MQVNTKAPQMIYSGLPKWAKATVAIGGLFIGYLVIKKFFDAIKNEKEQKEAQKKIEENLRELQILQSQGVPPSINKAQYNLWANAIQEQFAGCDFWVTYGLPVATISDLSPSAKALYNYVLQMNNDRDFLELVDSWDVRDYEQGWQCGGDKTNMTLYDAVNDELSSGEIKFINNELRNRGIKYNF
jgi:hypothetical protein